MLTSAEKINIIREVGKIHDFDSFGIGYDALTTKNIEVLRPPSMPQGLSCWILVTEEPPAPEKGLWDTICKADKPKTRSEEWWDMGRSCGSAVLTGAVSASGVLAAPVTGGGSTVITALTWTATGLAATQCGVGILRVYKSYHDPSFNQTLDNSALYNNAMCVADGVQIVSDVFAVASVVKVSGKIVKVSGGGRQVLSKLVTGFNRADRKLMARELSEAVSNAQFKRLVRSGDLSKLLTLRQIQWTAVQQLLTAVSISLDVKSSEGGGVIHYSIRLISETENSD